MNAAKTACRAALRADACRAVAETSDSAERKALWLERGQQWEASSLKAAERLWSRSSLKRHSRAEMRQPRSYGD